MDELISDKTVLNLRETCQCDIVVAVAGQPNVGKSTLFNVLTGELSRVGNWPGVTVSVNIGFKEWQGKKICFVDLPGIYGISATSIEEIIAREYILSEEPDIILVLVDATAPERTLYLPTQILELTSNVMIALTKMDLAHSYGIHIHVDKLESELGIPVIPISAIKGQGLRELLNKIVECTKKRGPRKALKIDYGGLEPVISEIEDILRKCEMFPYENRRWVAIRLLEGDARLEEQLKELCGNEIIQQISDLRNYVKNAIGRDPDEIIAISRFNFIDKLSKQVIVRVKKEKETWIEKIMEYVQKPIIGPIIGLSMLFVMFMIAFSINTGFPLNIIFRAIGLEREAELIETYSLSSILEEVFNIISNAIRSSLEGVAPEWFVSLIADGIIPGVGAVLSFLPLIIIITLFLSMLEDSGIAPRLAAGFHSFFAKFGLSGRAIYPMMISIGCNVPGIMVSRAAIEEEERKEIILSAPFIPCQARLVVILAFATAFFTSPIIQALILISIYFMGILIFLITSLVIRLLIFKKKEPPEFLLEMPPIHSPNMRVVWWTTWDYTKHFLKKAGVIIFMLSVVTWYLLSFGPLGMVTDPSKSYAAILGRGIEVILYPFGIYGENAWKVAFALIFGFIAKEGLIESIVLIQGGDLDVSEALIALGLNPAQAYALLVFMVLYVPCLATVAAIQQELKNWKLTLLDVLYMFVLAYIVSLLIYSILIIF